ncbi:MAG: nucleotidyltransferase family protein [Anaerolineales bacterium]|nr:nucleotidyltransferase family protein [Anaerolineales bacterium]
MDSTNHQQAYRLMTLCARTGQPEGFQDSLRAVLHTFSGWDTLPAQAEQHGMGPLLWYHLREEKIPSETRRALQGLYLRNRALNQIHAETLRDLLETLERHDIRPLLLKGLALAWQIYPDPALRPVSDIDLFVNKEQLLPTIEALRRAGYQFEPIPPSLPKAINAYAPPRAGITIHLELHHYDPAHRLESEPSPDDEFRDLHEAPQQIRILNRQVLTSSPLDTLLYLMRHLVIHLFLARTNRPIALKWIADIISLIEAQVDAVDWSALDRRDPLFRRRLAVLYSLTPACEKVRARLHLESPAPMGKLGTYPEGWPQWPFPNWREVGFWRYVWMTFAPAPEWWLRLGYGIDKGSTMWHAHVVYRAHLLRRMGWALARRLSAFF